MKNIIIFLLIFHSIISFTQKHDYNWAMGFGFSDTLVSPYQGNKVFVMKFGESILSFDTVKNSYYALTGRYINMAQYGCASFSDENGIFKYATEGKRIYDASWNVMENGDTLNPGIYWQSLSFNNTYRTRFGVIPLPAPGDKRYSYLIHTKVIKQDLLYQPFYSIIDLNANNGLGKVIKKNIPLFEIDTMDQPIVVQHANGRDWWIFYHKIHSQKYYKKLLTPNGFIDKGEQELIDDEQSSSTFGYYNSTISPNGKIYCRHDKWGLFNLYDFDRSNGELSNFRLIEIPDSLSHLPFMDFSLSSQFLYTSGISFESNTYYVAQIDITQNPPIIKIVSEYQGSSEFDCNTFSNIELGPDGKIYIVNGGNCMTIINKPDEPYPACDINEFSDILPFNCTGESMPHFPNYRLGAIKNSICDTITSLNEFGDINQAIQAFPNPASSQITIELTDILINLKNLSLTMVDLSGKILYERSLSSNQSKFNIDVNYINSGLYCLILNNNGKFLATSKVMIINR